MNCIEINNNHIINLDKVKEVRLVNKQFGGKALQIDDVCLDIKNAQALYNKIKAIMLNQAAQNTK